MEPVVPLLSDFAPVSPRERIETLDILRGFALFCILVVNWSVNSLWANDAWEGFSGTADQVTWWAAHVFLDEKSWPMFTFLFGLGFAIQMERAEARGAPFVATYARRLVVLFLIGAAHDILTERDILWSYALTGFLLLPVRKLNPNVLIVLALSALLIPPMSRVLSYRDFVDRFTNASNARPEITVGSSVLDAYVGEYALASMPYGLFVSRKGGTLLAQSPGVPGWDDIPIRLFAESETEFFSRSVDGARVSFVRDSKGIVTGVVARVCCGRDVPGRMIQRGQPTIDDKALRRVASQDPTYRTYATGTFEQVVSMRAQSFWQDNLPTHIRGLLGAGAVPLFLFGLYAGRRRLFHNIAANRNLFRKVMWWGLAFGMAGAAFETLMGDSPPGASFRGAPLTFTSWALARPGVVLSAPILGLAYLAALTLLLQRDDWKQRLRPLGAVGQMALTNYLLQSVAFVLLFFGYGLGWFGKMGPFGGLMLTLPLFAAQIAGSQWWLRRYRFGPAEWLWRSLTYGKRQPMRIPQPLVGSSTG